VSETTGVTRAILQMNAGNVRMLGRRNDGGGNANYQTNGATPFSFVVGQTYFLVGIMDYAAADIRVYINGVQHTGGTQTGFANLGGPGLSVNNTNATANIGSNTAGTGEQWRGLIDGVRIFDSMLTNQQILDIYNAEVVPEPATMSILMIGAFGLASRSLRRRKM
jgi:hypothetical protein